MKYLFDSSHAITWKNFAGRWIIRLVILVICLIVTGSGSFAESNTRHRAPDLFSREDIRINSGQTIGRLLVTGGDATVGGLVEKGILIVDGNLLLTADARVKGSVMVLGGRIYRDQGARLEKGVMTVSPGTVPVAGLLVFGLLLLGLGGLIAFPLLVLIILRSLQNRRIFLWMREQLAMLEQYWPALSIAFALTVSVLLFTFFAEMAYETLIRHQLDFFDNVLVWLVRDLASPSIDQMMIVISEFGYGYPFATMILIVLVTLSYHRHWQAIAAMALCLTGEALLNFFLKNLFARSRPDLFRVVEEAGYSFPSGHAMVSICFYGMLTFLVARNVRSWRWRLIVITLASVLVVAIGISRVYLGVHYPTDVVAGYFAGGMWLALCISLLLRWEHQSGEGINKGG